MIYKRYFSSAAPIGLMLLAFFYCYLMGQRGFFGFDQSIVFDGAYRIANGQVPYRDFFLPIGPIALWLQAIFFKIVAIDYATYLFCAAACNVVATYLAFNIVKDLTDHFKVALLSGYFVAIWFYPPAGTPWYTQTAFLCVFFSLYFFVKLIKSDASMSQGKLYATLTGIFAALSFLAKQNVGIIYLGLPLLYFVVEGYLSHFKKKLFVHCSYVMIGVVGTLVLFIGYLALKSDLALFSKYFFAIPGEEGRKRLLSIVSLFKFITREQTIFSELSLVFSAWFFSVLLYTKEQQRLRLIALISFYLNCFFIVVVWTGTNTYWDHLGAVAISWALNIYLCLWFIHRYVDKYKTQWLKIFVMFCSILVLWNSAVNFRIVTKRIVHDLFSQSQFQTSFQEPELWPLQWAEPTVYANQMVTKVDIDQIYKFLKDERKKNFYIDPRLAIFYGVFNKVSPQPVLWFHQGLTYRPHDDALQERFISNFVNGNIEIMILLTKVDDDKENEVFSNIIWNDFPKVKNYLLTNFVITEKIGPFYIYRPSKS